MNVFSNANPVLHLKDSYMLTPYRIIIWANISRLLEGLLAESLVITSSWQLLDKKNDRFVHNNKFVWYFPSSMHIQLEATEISFLSITKITKGQGTVHRIQEISSFEADNWIQHVRIFNIRIRDSVLCGTFHGASFRFACGNLKDFAFEYSLIFSIYTLLSIFGQDWPSGCVIAIKMEQISNICNKYTFLVKNATQQDIFSIRVSF